MGIREFILRPYFWWKARRKKQQPRHKTSSTQQEPIETPSPSRRLIRTCCPKEWEKLRRNHSIAEKNRERQQNTLGYGLKSRNFKPRPAFEKKLYDLTKKPEQEDD